MSSMFVLLILFIPIQISYAVDISVEQIELLNHMVIGAQVLRTRY